MDISTELEYSRTSARGRMAPSVPKGAERVCSRTAGEVRSVKYRQPSFASPGHMLLLIRLRARLKVLNMEAWQRNKMGEQVWRGGYGIISTTINIKRIRTFQ